MNLVREDGNGLQLSHRFSNHMHSDYEGEAGVIISMSLTVAS